ncbi:hypothetical protein ACHAWX_003786 [Stephanocyclus meneghinianus]
MGGGSKRSTRLAARKSKTGRSSKRKLESKIEEIEAGYDGGEIDAETVSDANKSSETEEETGMSESRTEGVPTSRRQRSMALQEDPENATGERPPTKPHDCIDDSLPENDQSAMKPSWAKRPREKLVESVEVVSLKRARQMSSSSECILTHYASSLFDRSSPTENESDDCSQSLTAPEASTSYRPQTKIKSPGPLLDMNSQEPNEENIFSTSFSALNEQLDRQSDNENCSNPSNLSTFKTADHDEMSSPECANVNSMVSNTVDDRNQAVDEIQIITNDTVKLTNQTPIESATEIAVVTSTKSCDPNNCDEPECLDISYAKGSQPLHTCIDPSVVVEQDHSINHPSSAENSNDLKVDGEMTFRSSLNLYPIENMQIGKGEVILDETLNLLSNDDNKKGLVDDTPTGEGNFATAEGDGDHDKGEPNERCDINGVEGTIEYASNEDPHHSTINSISKIVGTEAHKSTGEVPLDKLERPIKSDTNLNDVKTKEAHDSVLFSTNELMENEATYVLGDTQMEGQDNEDPSVESYSILESGGSIKSFAVEASSAVKGSERNSSVFPSVNASLKFRTFSSISLGENSQNLSWLEDDEKNLSESEGGTNIADIGTPTVEMRDLTTRLENDSMTDPNTAFGEVDKGMLPMSNEHFLSENAHDEIQTSQRAVDPEIFLQHASDKGIGVRDGSKVSDGVHFEFPKLNVPKQPPSVSQLKMALFLESTRVSRGVGAARDFANYWECLERYITLNSHASEMHRSRHGIDATLNSFLKTRKLKRLHNKLVLAIMSEAMRDHVSAHLISRHVPNTWKDKTRLHAPSPTLSGQEKSDANFSDIESDFQQWRTLLGKDSGAWTTYGSELIRSIVCTELDVTIPTSKTFQKDYIENEIIPTANIPAALQIDPLVRQYASNAGMRVSENAIWMIIVAAREYMTNVIKEVIANTSELEGGYVSQTPKSKIIPLACQWNEAKLCSLPNQDVNHALKTSNDKAVLIGAAELAPVLASDHAIAGGLASSRMSWMRSVISDRNDLGLGRLLQVNNAINLSITQAGAKKDMVNTTQAFEPHHSIRLPSIALQPRNKHDMGDAVSRSSFHSNLAEESENATDRTKDMPHQSSASLPTKSSVESNAAHSDIVDLTQYRPLAKAHFDVAAKPGPFPLNGINHDLVDSKSIVSPPVSEILNESEISEQTAAPRNEESGSLSIPFSYGSRLCTSLVDSKEQNASGTGKAVEETNIPLPSSV